jgi:hypothetical protein
MGQTLGAETIPLASFGTAGLASLPSIVVTEASENGVTSTENLVAPSPSLPPTLTSISSLHLAYRNETGSGPLIEEDQRGKHHRLY